MSGRLIPGEGLHPEEYIRGGLYPRGLYLSGLMWGFKRRIYPGGYIRGEGLISDTRKTFRIQH